MRAQAAAATLLVMLMGWTSQAQATSLTVRPGRRVVMMGETLTVSVRVVLTDQGSVQSVKFPSSPAFAQRDRSRSSQTQFFFDFNRGQRFQRILTYTLVLEPLRPGKHRFNGAVMKFRGRTYRSRPFSISVVGQARAKPRRGPTPPSNLRPRGDLFVTAELDRAKAYVGQQVVLSHYLYARVHPNSLDFHRTPKLTGFWVEPLFNARSLSWRYTHVRGEEYRTALLQRRALFPLKPGRILVDPLYVKISVGFTFFSPGRRLVRSSPQRWLKVRPLPSQGLPAGFNESNVGQFRLDGELLERRSKVGQAVTLKVSVSGTGNIKNLVLPAPGQWPGFKRYEPTIKSEVETSSGRAGGRKVYSYLLVPLKAGRLGIPALRFPYFDPLAGRYRVAATRPLTLTVAPGKGMARVTPVLPSPLAVLKLDGLAPIRFGTVLPQRTSGRFSWGWWYWMALALPLLLYLLLIVGERLRRQLAGAPAVRRRAALARARGRLESAGEETEDLGARRAAFAEVAATTHDFLEVLVGEPTRGLREERLGQVLGRTGASKESTEELLQLLEECDQARFAPGGDPGGAAEIAGRAASLLGRLAEVG